MQLFSAVCHSKARLDGKTAIITGCNTGIGKETVLDFYRRGAKVIMACRNIEKAEEAKTDIENTTRNEPNLGEIIIRKLDVSSIKSVREFSESILKEENQINILVNNAGIFNIKNTKTEDGFESHFGTNHLGHFLLTLLLLPKIIKSGPARIVNVSSDVHKFTNLNLEDPNFEKTKYGPWVAYGQSKLANVLFSKELAKKLKENNIQDVTCYSLHPGSVKTDIARSVDSFFLRTIKFVFIDILGYLLMKTPHQGAQTIIYCSVAEKCAGESGLYYSECAVTNPSNNGKNEELAKELWNLSMKLVKLDDYHPF